MIKFTHHSGKYIHIDGADIYYEEIGKKNAPVLLLLHGGFGTIEDFNEMLPDLYKDYRIIGIDSRGQGLSTCGVSNLTYQRIQQDVEKLLAHLNIDTLSIIGFSDGGIVAYRLAVFTKLKIEKLVTIGARWHYKNALATKDMFLKITPKSWREKFPFVYDTYQQLNPKPNFNLLTKLLVNMWLDAAPSGYVNEAVKNINCPLLAVRGDNDAIISHETLVEMATLVKDTTLLNIPLAGHMAFIDQPKIFIEALNKFLEN